MVKRLNRALWCVNLLLGAGNVLFAIFYLVPLRIELPPPPDSEPSRTAPLPDRSDVPLVDNPMRKAPGAPPPPPLPLLKGTLCAAFLKASGQDLVAYVGGPILRDGKPCDEFRGWTLEELDKDRASFKGEDGRTAELTLDAGAPGEPSGRASRAGAPYSSERFKSRLLSSGDQRQVWLLDPEEVDWAAQNVERMLDRDFQLAPCAGGGLRVESVQAGTLAHARGVIGGDIVREVNGQPLHTLQDIRALLSAGFSKQSPVLRLTLERAGKPFHLEYRSQR